MPFAKSESCDCTKNLVHTSGAFYAIHHSELCLRQGRQYFGQSFGHTEFKVKCCKWDANP